METNVNTDFIISTDIRQKDQSAVNKDDNMINLIVVLNIIQFTLKYVLQVHCKKL